MNYTKGKWEIYKGHDGQFNEKPYIMNQDRPSKIICQMIGDGIHNPEREANAHLIAAAPALYEALKALMPENEGFMREYTARALVIARAALAKAEGFNV